MLSAAMQNNNFPFYGALPFYCNLQVVVVGYIIPHKYSQMSWMPGIF